MMLVRWLTLCLALCAGLIACAPNPVAEPQALPTLMTLPTPTPPPQLQIRTLDYWTPATGRLASEGASEVWVFTGQQGDNISVRALSRGVQPLLSLYTPDGALLREGESLLAQLPRTGIYTVQVVAVEGAGEYDIGLGYSDRPNPNASEPIQLPAVVGVPTPLPVRANLGRFMTELGDRETVGGTFGTADGAHVYTFVGQFGQYVALELARVSGEIAPRLALYTPDGIPLAVDAGSGTGQSAVLRNVRLPDDGVYTVLAENRARPGGYSLGLRLYDAPQPVTPTLVLTPSATPILPVLTPTLEIVSEPARLQAFVPLQAELARSDDIARYFIDVHEGEVFSVAVRPLDDSPLIPRIEMIDPEGVPVAAVGSMGNPAERSAIITGYIAGETGTYSLLILAEGATFGGYTISYGSGLATQTVQRGEARADLPNTADLLDATTREAWYVNLRRGDIVSAQVVGLTDEVNVTLELVDADGRLLGIDSRETRDPQINGVRIPADGLYYFRVQAVDLFSTGTYALLWRYVDVAPTPIMPQGVAPVLTLEDIVADSAYNFYPFYGKAGQTIRVRVIAAENSEFDPVAALLDPSAQVVIEMDDTPEGDLNPDFIFTLPQDGTYNVRVNGYLQGGGFRLIVELLF